MLAFIASVSLPNQKTDRREGLSSSTRERLKPLESRLIETVRAENCRREHRIFTAKPHMAGSARNYELAQYVAEQWRKYGLEDVQLIEHPVYLPWPVRYEATLVDSREKLSLKEEPIPEDPDSYSNEVGIPYCAYSADVDITAPVVYVNSGNPEDYDLLQKQGVDVRGKIALARYSVPYSYRGFKALTAQKRGASALLLYSDPAEDGFKKGAVYPAGPWGARKSSAKRRYRLRLQLARRSAHTGLGLGAGRTFSSRGNSCFNADDRSGANVLQGCAKALVDDDWSNCTSEVARRPSVAISPWSNFRQTSSGYRER